MTINEKDLFEVAEGKESQDIEEMELEADEVMELELEIDDEDLDDMEKIIQEKVEKESIEAKAEKSKPGPKGPRKNKPKAEKKAKPKKSTAEEIKSNIQRHIKKGTIAAPQGRIEKLEDGGYRMYLAETVGTREDAGPHEEWQHVDDIKVMHHGKFILTNYAADKFGFPFKHETEDGEVIEHKYVRVELHKPGREKDVIEVYSVDEAQRRIEEIEKRKERNAKAKAKAEEKEQEKKEEVETA